ncbi:MAG: TetR/AcrR family transcriptional regulator [Acidimicrobiales bacterium]
MVAEPAERPPLRRDTIVAAAREMVRTGGLAKLSLRRLAARLGVTAPALYAHVADKSDLLRAVAEVEFDRLLDRFGEVEASEPGARVRAHFRAYVDHARENPELFDVMFLFPPGLGPASLPAGAELPAATRVFTVALGAVEEAIAAGEIISSDPVLVALTLWAACHGVATALQLGFGLPPELEDSLITEVSERLLAGWALPRPTG